MTVFHPGKGWLKNYVAILKLLNLKIRQQLKTYPKAI